MTAPRETLRQLAERARDAAAEYEAEKKADRFGRSTLVGPLATISHNAREALHAALSPEVVIALLDAASLGEKLREAMVSLPGRRLTIAIRGAAALVEFEDRHWLTRNEATRKLEEALATALSQPPTGDSTHA